MPCGISKLKELQILALTLSATSIIYSNNDI